MDSTIFLFLVQEGLHNGAIYALLGLAFVLVFVVTRVIFVPQGELVAYGALTYAVLEGNRVPGTVWLLVFVAAVTFAVDVWEQRRELDVSRIGKLALSNLAAPAVIAVFAVVVVPLNPGVVVKMLLTVALVTAFGPLLYRIAFRPMADASVLVLLIAAVGMHLALTGLGLVFFGAEGLRARPILEGGFSLGPLLVTYQSVAVYGISILVMFGLFVFFGRTLYGKALRATAVNRLGARLVGVRTSLSGSIAFTLAAFIGGVSGILIAPVTTVYYDTGFLIGLKGFVAAIIAGLTSFPGSVLAALLVGLVESFASFFASSFKEVIVFTLIIPVLMVRSFTAGHSEEE